MLLVLNSVNDFVVKSTKFYVHVLYQIIHSITIVIHGNMNLILSIFSLDITSNLLQSLNNSVTKLLTNLGAVHHVSLVSPLIYIWINSLD